MTEFYCMAPWHRVPCKLPCDACAEECGDGYCSCPVATAARDDHEEG